MTGFRNRLAQALVATILICAVGFVVCGWISTRGSIWERICIGLVAVMLVAMFSALGLVVSTYFKLRGEVAHYTGRVPLTDQEFMAMLPEGAGIDLELVSRIRALAAHYFRSLSGDRFCPDDRLVEDLHLFDLAPFGWDKFCAGLEESLGLENDQLQQRMEARQVRTFGDVILAAASFIAEEREPFQAINP